MRDTSMQRTERANFWVTNSDYAKTAKKFIAACEKVGIEPTKRQASKYRRRLGLAYKGRN